MCPVIFRHVVKKILFFLAIELIWCQQYLLCARLTVGLVTDHYLYRD